MTWAGAFLVLAGAALSFTGALGLLRLKTFYERVHPPTMGTTLGTGLVLIGSMLWFSALESRPVLHEVLIGVFMTLTTPVTYMLLVRAALHRDQFAAGKARGAVILQAPTVGIAQMRANQPERYHALLAMLPGEVYWLSGGVPLEVGGRVVGGIGVAGGQAGADDKICEAGIAAWRGK